VTSTGPQLKPIRHVSLGRSIATVVAVLLLPALIVAIFVASLAMWFAGRSTPPERDGFVIRNAQCTAIPESNRALLEFEATATEGVDFFSVEPLETGQVVVTGVASLGERSVDALDDLGVLGLNDQLADDDKWADLTTEPTRVVLELTRASAADDVHLSEITLWWATGEPAFLQPVPIDLDWSQDRCAANLR
jgi:hypothetical protein